ncbi:SDR family oxidoreductase [Solimonas sp. K1W22B-7]|uniref:SDR family NAD(P)-dependent oxidoreductase n=1 Tax=Solimonas sp. K1W22B-7 TaxID=2303331 RepID=UPI000E32EBE1|nr:SDR family oxidoreductase [Solimonas sp. K1W22B-7]AXQ30693.1 SDR family oxidoreductase [Solimonas sp. K1W22B-7]
MGQELVGKVAVITGAASGIGRATAELFVAEGARVVIADIDAAQGEALVAQLGEAALFQRTDVSNPDEVRALIDLAVSHFGGLHVMFNNAGIAGAMVPRFLDDDLKDFQKVIGVNLLGVMVGAQAAGRHMSKNGGGVIINNASIAGVLPGHALMSYRASKAAVIGFSKSIAIDLAEYGIRVNCLAPGHIRTPLTSFAPPGTSPEVAERIRKEVGAAFDSNQPLKRHGRPEDVAQTVLYLSGDRSAQITGVVLPIDGGITAGDPVNHLQEIMDARARAMAS